MGTRIAQEAGRVLRRVRQARGMTLRDVRTRSNRSFTSTTVAGYERAERAISLQRFCELARFYGIEPDRLLAEIMRRVDRRPLPTIDVAKVEALPSRDRNVLVGFIEEVRRLRGEAGEETITLRTNDLEVLAATSGQHEDEFRRTLRPALTTRGHHHEADQG